MNNEEKKSIYQQRNDDENVSQVFWYITFGMKTYATREISRLCVVPFAKPMVSSRKPHTVEKVVKPFCFLFCNNFRINIKTK